MGRTIIGYRGNHDSMSYAELLSEIGRCSRVTWKSGKEPGYYIPSWHSQLFFDGESLTFSGYEYDNGAEFVSAHEFMRQCVEAKPRFLICSDRAEDGATQDYVDNSLFESYFSRRGGWLPSQSDYQECCGVWTCCGQKRKIDADDLVCCYDSREAFDMEFFHWKRIETMPESLIPRESTEVVEYYDVKYPLLAGILQK